MKKITSYIMGGSLLTASLLNAHSGDHDHSQSVHELDPVVITAQPFARPTHELSQPWTVLDDIALDNIRTASLGETLNWQPGISSTHFTAGASRCFCALTLASMLSEKTLRSKQTGPTPVCFF